VSPLHQHFRRDPYLGDTTVSTAARESYLAQAERLIGHATKSPHSAQLNEDDGDDRIA